MEKITGKISTDVISDIKRLYVEDAEITRPCPKCGNKVTSEPGSGEYVSYGDATIHFYCCEDEGGCEHEWEVNAYIKKVKIVFEVDD